MRNCCRSSSESFPASRKVYQSGTVHPGLRVPMREIDLHPAVRRAAGDRLRPLRSLHRSRRCSIDIEQRAGAPARRLDQRARGRRGLPGTQGAAGRQRAERRGQGRAPEFPQRRAPLRARGGRAVTQLAYARAGIITPEMEYVAIRENIGRAQRAGGRARRQVLGRQHPGLRDPGVRARRGRRRPRHHPGEHQPPGVRADDHRPQLPGEDQRQHRQLRGDLLHGRGSRQDGVGDPLGRRHGHGPVHRAQHPQHPRMDRAQLAGADRHRADLPGAGEGRRAWPRI